LGQLSKSIAALSSSLEAQAKGVTAAHEQTTIWLTNQARDSAAALMRLADELNTRLAGLAADLPDEQRVCFKQLSLETREAAQEQTRARQAIDARLGKLERADSRPD